MSDNKLTKKNDVTGSLIDVLTNSFIEDCEGNFIVFWQNHKLYHMYLTPQKDDITIELDYLYTEGAEIVDMRASEYTINSSNEKLMYSIHLIGEFYTGACSSHESLTTIITFCYNKSYTDFPENIEKYINIEIKEA